MMTRKEKREMEKGINDLFEFLKTSEHFFKDLNKLLKSVDDPRHLGYVTYDTAVLLMMVMLKNACNLKSMRMMTNEFNKDECIENLSTYLGIKDLEELPHYDTINNFLSRLKPEELENIRTYMIKELLKKRSFDSYRIGGKYWGMVIDGTGLFTFQEKHCEHCLRREHKYKDKETGEEKTKTLYMHHVLEAKLVVGDMVLSVESEFIENESEDVKKQDCELNAFYRLAARLKGTFKRLPICIMADSLYACENVVNQCKDNHWTYIFRFKKDRIKSIANEFQALKNMEDHVLKVNVDGQRGEITWVNDIVYRERKQNVLECEMETEEGKQTFTFLTDKKITKKNAQKLMNAGRSRWKIENEGFNRQKNLRYHIQHAGSQNYTAMKNHYVLTQITEIIMMLHEHGSKSLKRIKKTAKEISSRLLEAFRGQTLTDEDIAKLGKPMQMRFT
ncbi:transposase family protein [Shouchella shacheensis]|uniref:transposase family protein n=1 Tax=Shouchella shacheensis TaxID=1649580 RepID=UPI00073FCDEC|nr:transposase family protein [Shouchella shacheensis]